MPNPLLTRISDEIPEKLHRFIRAWQCGIEIDAEFTHIHRFHEANNHALRVTSIYHMLFHHKETLSKLLDQASHFNSIRDLALVRFAHKDVLLDVNQFIDGFLNDQNPDIFFHDEFKGIFNSVMKGEIRLTDLSSAEHNQYEGIFGELLVALESALTAQEDNLPPEINDLIVKNNIQEQDTHSSLKHGQYQNWIDFCKKNEDPDFKAFYDQLLEAAKKELGEGLYTLSTLRSDEEQMAYLMKNPNIVFGYYQSDAGDGDRKPISTELQDKTWANEPILGTAAAMLGYQLTIYDKSSKKTMKLSEDKEATHIYLHKGPVAWDPNPDKYAQKYCYIKHDGNCGYDSFLSAIKADYDNLSQEEKALLLEHKQNYFKPFSIENETYAPIRRFLCCPTPFFSHCGQSSMFTPVRVIGYPVIITTSALILGHFGLAALSLFMLSNPAATVALILLCTATSIGLVEGVNQLYMSPQV